MKVIITTCDEYDWIIPIFKYFFEKHWPDNPYQIEILTETNAIDYPVFCAGKVSWASRLINYLKQSKEDKILFTLEDYLIQATVDTDRIRVAENLCQGDVGCVRLSNCPYKYFKQHIVDSPIIDGFREYPLHGRFSMVAHIAFFQKEFLLDVLQHGEDVWETENNGSARLGKLGSKWRVFWPEIDIVNYTQRGGLIKKGRFRREVLSWLLAELSDKKECSKELMILQNKINQGLRK